jgi:hypothetical protein
LCQMSPPLLRPSIWRGKVSYNIAFIRGLSHRCLYVGVEPYPNLRRIQNFQGFEGKFGEKVIHHSEWSARFKNSVLDMLFWGREKKWVLSKFFLYNFSRHTWRKLTSTAFHSHLNRARSGVSTSSWQNLQSLSSQPIRGHRCSVIRQRLESSRRVSSFSRKCNVLSPSQVMFRSSSF